MRDPARRRAAAGERGERAGRPAARARVRRDVRLPSLVDRVRQRGDRRAGWSGEFTVEFTVNPADINAAKLAQADLVLFNSTTGRTPLSQQQRDEFAQWIGCGGGFIGVHASGDNNYGWPLYAELVGPQFEAHPQLASDPPVRLLVEDSGHPINAAWEGRVSFEIQDELYRWRRDPRGTRPRSAG